MQSMESFAGLLAAAGPGILEVEGTGAGEPSSSSSSTDNVSNFLGVGAGLEGVVTIIYHARQALGGLSKPTGIKMCQVQFHTNNFTPGKPCHVWPLEQIDGITEPVRYNNNFRLVMNCSTSEECSGRDVSWPPKDSKQLLFNSDQDFQETIRLIPNSGAQRDLGNSKFFVGSPGVEKLPSIPTSDSRTVFEADLLNVKAGGKQQNETVMARSQGVTPTDELIAGVSEPMA